MCVPSSCLLWATCDDRPPRRPLCDCFEHAQNFTATMASMAMSERPVYHPWTTKATVLPPFCLHRRPGQFCGRTREAQRSQPLCKGGISKQPRRLWFGTSSRSLWRHSNGLRRHQSISRQILDTNMTPTKNVHEDVIKWKHFPRYWPFVWGIPRSPVNSPPKGQWRGALMFSLICARINGWVNNREAGDLRRHCAHYDIIVMRYLVFSSSCMLFEEAFCQRKCVTRGLIRTLPLYLWQAPKWWPLSRPFEYFIMDLQYWGPNKNGRHFRTTFQ